nr:MAG TPA: hypothetical protein [Caudoviricetes sp.]
MGIHGPTDVASFFLVGTPNKQIFRLPLSR